MVATIPDTHDIDLGRDIGEPDTDPRSFADYLRDYVTDAASITAQTPDCEPYETCYRAGLHDAAREIYARYLQEHDDGQLA